MSEHLNDLMPTQENIETDLLELFQQAVRQSLVRVLQEEVTLLVGAATHARSAGRHDVRNGSYPRQIVTSVGEISFDVPRTRDHGAATATLGRYKRRVQNIDDAIIAAYVGGVSTRKLGDVTAALMGQRVDKSTVSRVTKALECDVEALRAAPIVEDIIYLFVDATYVRARWAREVEQTAALVAYGVGRDGHRRLLAVAVDAAESEASWTALFTSLVARGLRGVQLIIGDEHAGIVAAARSVFPDAKRQRCTVHLMRNVMAKAPSRLHARLGRELARIFAAKTVVELKRRAPEFRAGLGKQVPEAVAIFDKGFPAATQYTNFPVEHWPRIRTTNGVERINAEIKRRTRVVGAFPDRASCLRLIAGVVLHCVKQWAYRPYLNMSGFRTLANEEGSAKLAA